MSARRGMGCTPKRTRGCRLRAHGLDEKGVQRRGARARVDLGLDGRQAELGQRDPFLPTEDERRSHGRHVFGPRDDHRLWTHAGVGRKIEVISRVDAQAGIRQGFPPERGLDARYCASLGGDGALPAAPGVCFRDRTAIDRTGPPSYFSAMAKLDDHPPARPDPAQGFGAGRARRRGAAQARRRHAGDHVRGARRRPGRRAGGRAAPPHRARHGQGRRRSAAPAGHDQPQDRRPGLGDARARGGVPVDPGRAHRDRAAVGL